MVSIISQHTITVVAIEFIHTLTTILAGNTLTVINVCRPKKQSLSLLIEHSSVGKYLSTQCAKHYDHLQYNIQYNIQVFIIRRTCLTVLSLIASHTDASVTIDSILTVSTMLAYNTNTLINVCKIKFHKSVVASRKQYRKQER